MFAFFLTFFLTLLVAVIYEGSFNAYGIPEFVVGPEFGISETGNLQFLYGFSYFRVIKQVSRNWRFPVLQMPNSGPTTNSGIP